MYSTQTDHIQMFVRMVNFTTEKTTFNESMAMSVLLECEPGDEFVCIGEFHASPNGEPFSWESSRKFRVGERLRYLAARQNPNLKDHPSEWHVVFEAGDGKRYSATQSYFVTEECWLSLKKYFARRLLRDPKPQRVQDQRG